MVKTTVIVFFCVAVFIASSGRSTVRHFPVSDKSLTFTFNRFYMKDTLKFVECTLSNNTDSTFWILAYDTTHVHGKIFIRPIFSLEEKKKGKWDDSGLGFSGIGIDRFIFKPGDKYYFETPDFDRNAEAIKIGIDLRIRSSDNTLRIARQLWSDEIRLNKE
jgi:hypothetical protein